MKLPYRIYNPMGRLVGRVRHAEDAAPILAAYGTGATVRIGRGRGRTLYVEGVDGDSGDSYDRTGEIIRRNAEEVA